MTDDRTLTVLDERARAAAVGARAAAAERPVPAFDPDVLRIAIDEPAPRAPRRLPVLVAAAVVLVVLVGVALVVGTRGDDGAAPADRSGAPVRYRLGEVPAGFAVGGVLDGPLARTPGEDEGDLGVASVYGPDEADPRLGVAVLPPDIFLGGDCVEYDDDGDCADLADGTPAEVAGLTEVTAGEHRAWEVPDVFGADALVAGVDDVLVVVAGGTLPSEARVAAAAAVTVDGDVARVAPDGLPDGFGELPATTLTDLVGPSVGFGSTWRLWYQRDGEVGSVIDISVRPGSDTVVGIGSVTADESEDVTVRGSDGVLTSVDVATLGDSFTTRSLRWQEPAGQVVTLTVGGPSDEVLAGDEVLRLAEGLVPVDDTEVAELRQEVADAGLDAPGVTVVGEGTFSDGSPWKLVHGTPGADLSDSGLSLRSPAVSTAAGSTTSGTTPGSALGGEAALASGDAYAWAYGPVTSDAVARVVVTVPSGEVEATVVRGEGRAGWVAELPAGLVDLASGEADQVEVVAYDAAGAELDRLLL